MELSLGSNTNKEKKHQSNDLELLEHTTSFTYKGKLKHEDATKRLSHSMIDPKSSSRIDDCDYQPSSGDIVTWNDLKGLSPAIPISAVTSPTVMETTTGRINVDVDSQNTEKAIHKLRDSLRSLNQKLTDIQKNQHLTLLPKGVSLSYEELHSRPLPDENNQKENQIHRPKTELERKMTNMLESIQKSKQAFQSTPPRRFLHDDKNNIHNTYQAHDEDNKSTRSPTSVSADIFHYQVIKNQNDKNRNGNNLSSLKKRIKKHNKNKSIDATLYTL